MNWCPGANYRCAASVKRLDTHSPHQPAHALAVDRKAFLAQRPRDRRARTARGEQASIRPHRIELIVTGRSGLSIDARTTSASIAHCRRITDRHARIER